jgi:SulP family sulfate permease
MISQYVSDLRREFSNYNKEALMKDILSGLTVAAVALPLALAFGVASGADAASGLVTAIFAGVIIGLLSGASFQISGPTGTMVAILIPISVQQGIEAVLVITFISGIALLIAAFLKVGKIVAIIPSAVLTGFTAGISILIASSQIDNFFGTTSYGDTLIQKIGSYFQSGFHLQWQALFFGLLAVAIIVLWPKKWATKVPASLIAIIVALIVNIVGPFNVAEVGEIPRSLILENRLRFSYLNLENIKGLIAPGLSVAALVMIESLLSGAAGSKITKERFDADRQLVAQGIGNLIIPFVGGVPAAAAIARSSVAIRSGLKTRLTSVIHSLALLASMFLLSPLMGRIPLSALAGVLMVTAWRMNDWESTTSYFKNRYKAPISQYLITMAATVVFDLTAAILIGIGFSIIIFVFTSSSIEITVSNIDTQHDSRKNITKELSKVKLVYVTGQLFFGSQDQLLNTIGSIKDAETIILSVRGVPSIDHSAMVVLEELHQELSNKNINLLFCGLQPRVKNIFYRAGFDKVVGKDAIFDNAVAAIDSLIEA